jgi:uncharacterized protein (TIGR00369 family)
MNDDSTFNRMRRGEIPPPPVFTLLGGELLAVDAAAGTLEARYQGEDAFRNPAGTIQGGMLGAMLDDLAASLVDATLSAGEACATLNLNLSFLRPAKVGAIEGRSWLVKRGRDVCHAAAELSQQGKLVATATATCRIVRGGE